MFFPFFNMTLFIWMVQLHMFSLLLDIERLGAETERIEYVPNFVSCFFQK